MNTATKTIRSKDQNTEILTECFGVFDAKGREIGSQVQTFEVDFTELPADASSYWEHEPGHFFAYRPSATRNGQSFGALARKLFFKTAAERDAAVAKYFASARKRAAKKAA